MKIDAPPLSNDRVKNAIDKVLAEKGWQEVPTGGNVSLVAIGTTHEKRTLETFYDGFGFGGDGTATTTVERYRVGTLIVDMLDSKTKKLI